MTFAESTLLILMLYYNKPLCGRKLHKLLKRMFEIRRLPFHHLESLIRCLCETITVNDVSCIIIVIN